MKLRHLNESGVNLSKATEKDETVAVDIPMAEIIEADKEVKKLAKKELSVVIDNAKDLIKKSGIDQEVPKNVVDEALLKEEPLIGDVEDYSDDELDQDIADLEAEKERRLKVPASNQIKDVSFLFNGKNELEWRTKEDLGNDFMYRTLCKNVREVEKFNFHSDYWGDASTYQQENIDVMEDLKPYIGKRVKIETEEGSITFVIEGLLIDKQYNSVGNSAVLIKDVKEENELTENKLRYHKAVKYNTLKEDLEQPEDAGFATIVTALIKDEWDAIDAYQSAIVNAENNDKAKAIFEDIMSEEMIHIGQLESLLQTVNTTASKIEDGQKEDNLDKAEDISDDFNSTEELILK